MKRFLTLIPVLLACLTLFAFAAGKKPVSGSAESCLRLHVVANSDSDEDQEAKLAVRDAILEKVREDFCASTKEAAVAELIARGGELQTAAEEVLKERGLDYGAQLMAGEFDFPDREYGDEFYPAGKYDALRVVLGSGEGHNWWCVMFPPLCLVETENAKAEFNEDGTLVFRSAVWEFIKAVFGG